MVFDFNQMAYTVMYLKFCIAVTGNKLCNLHEEKTIFCIDMFGINAF